MDIRNIYFRFRQFGGFRLLKEYLRLGVFSTLLKGFVKRKPIRSVYGDILQIVEPQLRDRFMPLLLSRKAYYSELNLNHQHCNIVWFCWLQGLNEAPPIVKACFSSLKHHLVDRDIRVITSDNWREYVDVPDYIEKRWNNKQMPPAHFSDLLRLQLLIRYGGTWIDSTVLCTGSEHAKAYLDADLFLFQYTPIEYYPKSFAGISSWFITSYSNHEILLILRDLFCAYWKEYEYTLDYYLIHLFFSMIAKEYPYAIRNMPYGYSVWSLTLKQHWGESFNQKKWDKLTSIVNFHKLAYRVDEKVKADKANYYNWILEKYR